MIKIAFSSPRLRDLYTATVIAAVMREFNNDFLRREQVYIGTPQSNDNPFHAMWRGAVRDAGAWGHPTITNAMAYGGVTQNR